jgi:hypothetical protein
MNAIDMRGLKRGVLFSLVLLTSAAHGYTWELSVDGDGVHHRWGEPEIPAFITNFDNPKSDEPMGAVTVVPSPEYVPCGLYAGEWGDATWDYIFTKIVEGHGNSYWLAGTQSPWPPGTLNGSDRAGHVALARTAARLGLRVYYENQNGETYWPATWQPPPASQNAYNETSGWADDMLAQFATDIELRQGILCWGITQETDLATAQEPLLADLKNDVFDVYDPYHPMIIEHRVTDGGVQEAQYTAWGGDAEVPIIVTGPYINDRPVSRLNQWALNAIRLALWQSIAMNHNSKLWVIVPCFSQNNPSISSSSGWRTVVSEEMSWYLWTSLAYGSTGFYLFKEYDGDGRGRAALTRFDWEVTEEYAAAQRFWRTLSHVEPLLRKWTSSTATTVSSGIARGWMSHPDYTGLFLVIANVSPWNAAAFTVPGDATYYELVDYTAVSGTINLDPGMGMILFKDTSGEIAALTSLLGPVPGTNGQDTLTASQAQLWTASSDEQTVVARTNIAGGPITFGGKGGLPWIYLENTPGWGGDLRTWRTSPTLVKVPAGVYYPPHPGASEEMLFLKWDSSDLPSVGAVLEKAVFTVTLSASLPGGRLAVYPVAGEGDDILNGVLEFMPRWELDEIDDLSLGAGSTVRVDITGMVQEWISKSDYVNRGLLVVYEGFPDNSSGFVQISAVPTLELAYRYATPTCEEIARAGVGLTGDIDQDCHITFVDFATLLGKWFMCNEPTDPTCF